MTRDFKQEPIRVVHLIHTVAHGGVETILVNWMQELRGSRLDVRLVCFANADRSEQPFVDACRRENIDIETIPWSKRKPVFKAARQLSRILDEHRAEVLHAHNTYADIVAYVSALRRPVKLVSSVYVWSDFGWKRNLMQALNKVVLQRFACVVSQCDATRLELTRRGLPEATSRVVISGFEPAPAPLEAAERSRRRRARGVDDETVLFANVARCYPEKAQAKLLDAFKIVKARHANARLWLYGTGPLEEELKDYARTLALGDTVEFVGFAPAIDEELQLVDAQVHPSFAEGVPLAVCSGMAAGIPLVASAVGGIPEMITHEVNGLLVPAASDPAFLQRFVAAVERMILERETRLKFGHEALRFMQESYSMEAAMAQLFAVYAELLAA